MDEALAVSMVREMLDGIAGDPRLGLDVPVGFTVEQLSAEEQRNPFAPSLAHWRVTATLDVPILYSPDSSSGVARAALPANRENLEALRARIDYAAQAALAIRAELREWKVEPEEPPPYLPDGRPNGPPASWTATAILEID